jgi:hypothetical protein
MSVDVAWALGATVRLAIANTGGTPINGWTMSFTVADGVRIGQGWNGVWVQRGGTVTVRDAGYNAHVPPGNILGNVGANVAAPGGLRDSLAAGFVLNGTPCQTV